VDGSITAMDVDVVDADGSPVPINRLMLHHIVFTNLGSRLGEKRDGTCGSFTAFDSRTRLPAIAERFYGAGEERGRMLLPAGYGYPMKAADTWGMTYMLMNHRNRTDRAFIEYHVTYDTDALTPVKPYWLDVKNCLVDPVFDVPGGGRRGSTYRRSATWTVPESGRLVAAGGHVHGGAKDLALVRAGCPGRPRLYTSRPLWGNRDHPFYNVRPVLHEPGPINMSGFTSAQGFAVSRGERLRLDANYDNELVHTRVMGIMVVFLAPDSSVGGRCAPPPGDVTEYRSTAPGRTRTPRFKVPIVGIRRGVARNISAPPGKRVRVRSGYTVKAGERFFRRPNIAVRQGAVLNWTFFGENLHNVTVASGPRGFSSVNLSDERSYRKRLTVPGTYKLFCGLHPVDMTATVKVHRRRGRR